MAYNSKAIKTDVNAKPIPQYYNPVTDEYEVLQGVGGAARQVLYGSDGEPISTTEGKLAVRAAELETKIEAVRVLLNALTGEDFATQTTLAQILEKMIANPATAAKQDSLATLVGAIEDKLDGVIDGTTGAARQVLYGSDGEPISTTEGKLAVRAAEIEMAIANLQTALLGSQSTAAKQDAIAGLVGALDAAAVSDPAATGAVIALLKGVLERLQTVEGKIDGITDGTTPAKTELTGSKVGVMQSDPVVGERTVTATAAEMHAGTSPLAGRYEMVVLNTSANTVYWGSAGVTLETGFPLLPNDSVHFKFHPETHTAIYFIADGEFTVKVVELS